MGDHDIDKESDPKCVFFNAGHDLKASQTFSALLNNELSIRDMNDHAYLNLQTRRDSMISVLQVEDQMRRLSQAIKHGTNEEGEEASLLLIEQAIPCILHMEMRCREKILGLLLKEKLDTLGGVKKRYRT